MNRTLFSHREPVNNLPSLPEIDGNWIPFRLFVERNHYEAISEEDFFRAADLAVKISACPITPVVLAENSQKEMCLNPKLIDLIRLCLDNMLNRNFAFNEA